MFNRKKHFVVKRNQLKVPDVVAISELMKTYFSISSVCCIAIKISYVYSIFIAFEYHSFLVDKISNSLFDTPFALLKV